MLFGAAAAPSALFDFSLALPRASCPGRGVESRPFAAAGSDFLLSAGVDDPRRRRIRPATDEAFWSAPGSRSCFASAPPDSFPAASPR